MENSINNGINYPTRKRVAYLDMLKCLGMFIVVQGHIHTHYGWFSLPLHSYVIPLYFLLSGLTFRRTKFPTFRGFATHRAKTLLLPYVILSIITWAIWVVFNYVMHNQIEIWRPLLQTLIAQGSGGFLVHNVPLWFIPCLFIIETMYYFIDKLSTKFNIITCVLCAFIGVWMINGPYSDTLKLLPWSIESAFAALIFYCTGNVITKKWTLQDIGDRIVSRKWAAISCIIILSTVLVFSAFWNEHVSLGSDLLGRSPFLFYINAFIGITTIFLFAVLVCSIKYNNLIWKKIIDFHLFFGKNSFYIMATHVPIKGVIIVAVAKLLHKTNSYVVNDYLCAAVIFALTCALSSLAAIIILRQKQRDQAYFERLRMK